MIAELKQILTKPAKYNKDGELSHDKYVAVNLNIPIGDEKAEAEVLKLYDLLRDKQVYLDIQRLTNATRPEGSQMKMFDDKENDEDQESDFDDEETEEEEVTPLLQSESKEFKQTGVVPA